MCILYECFFPFYAFRLHFFLFLFFLRLYIYFKIINWRIIALQNFVVSCHTSTRISHRYTSVPSLQNLPPHPTLLYCHRDPVLVPWVQVLVYNAVGHCVCFWFCTHWHLRQLLIHMYLFLFQTLFSSWFFTSSLFLFFIFVFLSIF